MDAFGVYLIVVVGACLLAIAAAVRGHRKTLGRWGGVRGPILVPFTGGYRDAAVPIRTSEVVAHTPAPGVVLGAGLATRLWGAMTFFVFVPAGGLAATLLVGGGDVA